MNKINDDLKHVTQLIPTIQGEGPKVGVSSLLIRFKECNLDCTFCDTKWSNKHSSSKFTPDDIDDIMDTYIIKNVMITGGEPFMYIKNVVNIINYLYDNYNLTSFEIETNGTLHTKKNLNILLYGIYGRKVNITLNISPKLEVSAHKDLTLDGIVLKYKNNYNNLHSIICGSNNDIKGIRFIYKFVYSPKFEKNIYRFFTEIGILSTATLVKSENIYMMPLTPDINDSNFENTFRKSCQRTAAFCLKHGFKYSCREHVWVYGNLKDEHMDINND